MQVWGILLGHGCWYQNAENPKTSKPERKIKGKTTIKGAIFEVNITQRVWKLRLFKENEYLVGLKGYLWRFLWIYANFDPSFMI
jgi:hypothetical protein